MNMGHPITLPNVSKALIAICYSSEPVNLEIKWFSTGPKENGSQVGRYRAALRGGYMGGDSSVTYPIFDPHCGERELAGWGSDPLDALRALEKLCSEYGWEDVFDGD